MRIGIIGAGIAGLACANRLARSGYDTVLFDKGRGPGGRMSTRRMSGPAGELRFDHGAQYFTVRDPDFAAQVKLLERNDDVARWPAAGDDAWVGKPGMNHVIKALALGRNVHWSARVDHLRPVDAGWEIAGDGFDPQRLDAVIVAVPAEQAAILLAPLDEVIATRAQETISEPCWTVMAAFAQRLPLVDDVLRHRGDIGWAARDSAKSGREQSSDCWVIQASVSWSRQFLEAGADEVQAALLSAFAAEVHAAGGHMPAPVAVAAHRWRYARTTASDGAPYWHGRLRLGVCGDWLGGARVEAAWLSGHRLAGTILTDAA